MWGTDQEKREFGGMYPLFYGKLEECKYVKGINVIKKLASNV
jgi:hypothetical protein